MILIKEHELLSVIMLSEWYFPWRYPHKDNFISVNFSVHGKYQFKLTCSELQQNLKCFYCFPWSKYVEVLYKEIWSKTISRPCPLFFDCFQKGNCDHCLQEQNSGCLKFSLVLLSIWHMIASLCWYSLGIYKDPWQWTICMWQFISGHHDNLGIPKPNNLCWNGIQI